jgi:cytochrome c556
MRDSSPAKPSLTQSALIKLCLFLLGIVLGAAAATQVVNALRQRDAYPRGVMDVMQHHYALLRQDVRLQRCDAKATTSPVFSLRQLAGDLENVFYPDAEADAPFREHAQRLRDGLTAATTATDCSTLAPIVDKIGAACDACHREYR